MDPYTQHCSFQNLLNNQQPITQNSYQPVPREPTVEVSASDASMFGSQWTEDGNEDAEIFHGEDEAMARPEGVKAAKAKRKKPVRKQATLEAEEKEKMEFQSFWEIRQKDFALKATLNKQKLLESLVAKSEPLSELGMQLKNKLITDLLA
ncbi:hypothetical protein Bca52824_076325 [Brassica carinata]|uniref:Uncharacterized protein n=1 Tax=Brassica carinata TaxID=52824 RepID=A0A8X7TYZ2_BRACI|nr:hypothetical protein Bca52824_076325 [Brassica carinata]